MYDRAAVSGRPAVIHYSIIREAYMSNKSTAQAVLVAVGVALSPAAVFAAGQDTTSIKRDAESAKALAEPSYQTREERLNSKPLDWNATIGKPKRKAATAAEKKALGKVKGETSEGGAPDPKADEEARRLYPQEWKSPEK
jgi:hypothetical protein